MKMVLDLVLILDRGCRWKNAPKLERQNMRNQTIFELDTDDNKSKYCSSSKDILKSVKNL